MSVQESSFSLIFYITLVSAAYENNPFFVNGKFEWVDFFSLYSNALKEFC